LTNLPGGISGITSLLRSCFHTTQFLCASSVHNNDDKHFQRELLLHWEGKESVPTPPSQGNLTLLLLDLYGVAPMNGHAQLVGERLVLKCGLWFSLLLKKGHNRKNAFFKLIL
jgi:hypothetical protein